MGGPFSTLNDYGRDTRREPIDNVSADVHVAAFELGELGDSAGRELEDRSRQGPECFPSPRRSCSPRIVRDSGDQFTNVDQLPISHERLDEGIVRVEDEAECSDSQHHARIRITQQVAAGDYGHQIPVLS